jgi:hypothetical protein
MNHDSRADAAGATADPNRLHELTRELKRRVGAWLDDRRYLRDRARLVDDIRRRGEFDVLLEALDMTAEQFAASRIPPVVAAELSQRMLERLGCASRIEPLDMQEVTQRCGGCDAWTTCRRWLDAGHGGDGYREFCLNAQVFAQLRAKPE